MTERATCMDPQQAAALNACEGGESTRSSTHFNTSNRFVITLIVYLALLLDNMLLTVIVPILPDYLASLNSNSSKNRIQLYTGNFPFPHLNVSGAQHVVYRSPESSSNLLLTKHPIPGKSMVNFTLLQWLNDADKSSYGGSTAAMRNDSALTARYSSGSNMAGSTTMTTTSTTNTSAPLASYDKHARDMLTHENGSIGLLLAMKALIQLIFNPIVGNASSKYGYRLPIVLGTFCLLLSSLVFAVGETYLLLLLARAIQGVGSACIDVCGMSLVAQHYPEEARRSKVMGIILGSIALGVLLGYPFGSILYDLFGKSAPFMVLSVILFLNLGMQLLTMDLSVQPEVHIDLLQQTSKWRPLLESKMILAIVVAIWFSTSTMAILEPCLPIWLMQYLRPTKWQLGTVFIPDSVGYFVGTNFFGSIAYKYGQVKVSCISLLLVGMASILIPSATTVAQLLLPHFVLGLGIGIIDAALVPLLATFVDSTLTQDENTDANYMSRYGTVYAIQQTSVSLAYCLAPLIGGELAQIFGFAWLMRIVGLFNIIYGPILVYLYQKYDPKSLREQHNDLLLKSGVHGGSQYRQLYNSMDME